MKCWIVALLLSISFCSIAQEQEDASLFYKKGLEGEERNDFKVSFYHFLRATRLANQGSELQLKSIYKIAFFINYADQADKPEIHKWISNGVHQLLQSKRSDTLSANLYSRAGQIYRSFYQPDSALLCFNLAIKRFDQLYGKESVDAADCYMGSGNVYESFYYDYNKAEALYERALAIREKLPKGELADFMIGILYANLVEVNRKQKDLNKAVFYEVRNIPFAESIIASYPPFRENAYEGLAITYRDLGQLDKARSFYRKAMVQNIQVNHHSNNALLGSYYESLGELDEKDKSAEDAIQNYQKAEQIFRSLKDGKSPKYIKTLQNLSRLYANRDEVKSVYYLRIALQLTRQNGLEKSGQAAELNGSIGDFFAGKNQIDSALVYYQWALRSCSKTFSSTRYNDNPSKSDITLIDYAYEMLLKKGALLSQQFTSAAQFNYAESALKCYSLAETLLSESRIDLDTDRARWNFFDSNFGMYEQALSLIFKMSKVNGRDDLSSQSLRYMESSKSKTLSDALNQAEFADPLIGKDSLIQSLNEQKRNLHLFEDQIRKIDSTSADSRAKITAIGNAMIASDRAIQRIEQQLNEKYPSYLKTRYQNQIHSLKEIQNYVKQKKTTLIEFFWGEKEVFAIGISAEKFQLERIGKADSVEQIVKTMLHFLKSTQNDYSQQAISSFSSSSSGLYTILLKPFEQQLKASDHLIIIPDGLIGQLPFEIMTRSTEKLSMVDYRSLSYLVRTHFISYAFSSNYLLDKKEQQSTAPRLLAFGFTGGNERSGQASADGDEIMGSKKELEALSEKFPDGEFFMGNEVTEKRFKEKASSFDIIHLAVHGEGDTEKNYSAGLYFRDSLSSGSEDGRLNWYELFDMHLQAQLTVISSCESGIGKSYRGEGMLSMANAFAYAGCRSVVMGLWKVNDNVSVMLMDSFYKKIRSGEPVDDALTYAKRDYLESGDGFSDNPKLWASLVAYGNGQVVKEKIDYLFYIKIVAILISIGIVFLVAKRIRLKSLSNL